MVRLSVRACRRLCLMRENVLSFDTMGSMRSATGRYCVLKSVLAANDLSLRTMFQPFSS